MFFFFFSSGMSDKGIPECLQFLLLHFTKQNYNATSDALCNCYHSSYSCHPGKFIPKRGGGEIMKVRNFTSSSHNLNVGCLVKLNCYCFVSWRCLYLTFPHTKLSIFELRKTREDQQLASILGTSVFKTCSNKIVQEKSKHFLLLHFLLWIFFTVFLFASSRKEKKKKEMTFLSKIYNGNR